MMLTPTLSLGIAMLFAQPRLAERALADIAVIQVPRSTKEMYEGVRDDQQRRLVFTFSSDYFWASLGSGMAYKQQLFVSLMAPDASDAEYAAYPTRWSLSYDDRKRVTTSPVGSGTLTVFEGLYRQNTLQEPSYTFFYVDRARRLQIAWHAVKKEIDLATGTEVVGRMASSFRIVRDPGARFTEIRDRPRKDAEDRARKHALAAATLEREGYGPLAPGKPVRKNDVYVEWMADPEPRFQLLLPLGRVRVAANATPPPIRTMRAIATTTARRRRTNRRWLPPRSTTSSQFSRDAVGNGTIRSSSSRSRVSTSVTPIPPETAHASDCGRH